MWFARPFSRSSHFDRQTSWCESFRKPRTVRTILFPYTSLKRNEGRHERRTPNLATVPPSPSTRSTACSSWDARVTSAWPDPERDWGQCAHTRDPCTTLALTCSHACAPSSAPPHPAVSAPTRQPSKPYTTKRSFTQVEQRSYFEVPKRCCKPCSPTRSFWRSAREVDENWFGISLCCRTEFHL